MLTISGCRVDTVSHLSVRGAVLGKRGIIPKYNVIVAACRKDLDIISTEMTFISVQGDFYIRDRAMQMLIG